LTGETSVGSRATTILASKPRRREVEKNIRRMRDMMESGGTVFFYNNLTNLAAQLKHTSRGPL